jgi:(2Fe-2S) ferredoxin
MLGRFKTLKRDIQETPLSLFARKGSAEAVEKRVGVIKKHKTFCDPAGNRDCLTVCAPMPECTCDAAAVRQTLQAEIERRNLSLSVGDAKIGCGGKCKRGPLLGFPQKGFFYHGVTPETVPEILEETIVNGRILFPLISIEPNRSYRSDIYYERETGLIAAIDDKVCMVDVAKYFLDFEEGLSCGKCVPCRLGMKRMQETVDRIAVGKGVEQDLEQIRTLCQTMVGVPHCDFAVTSSRPILSALTYFEDEFRAHIERKECPAGVCTELVELQKKLARQQQMRQRQKKKKK